MRTDEELLELYRNGDGQAAFTEIVNRYLDLVYSVAVRQLGAESHLADDVSQEVFLTLARKAKALGKGVVLSGWLYRSTLYAAKNSSRKQSRRRKKEAQLMEGNVLLEDAIDWENLRPVLDEALCELGQKDRDAVCLRYLQDCSLAEVGRTLGLSEDAARMRVKRAMAKLEVELGRRGIRSTVAAMGLAIGGQAGIAAPAGLGASVAQLGLAAGGSVPIWGAVFSFLNTTKAVSGVMALASVLAAGGALLQFDRLRAAEREFAERGNSHAGAAIDLDGLKSTLAELEQELVRLKGPKPAPSGAHGFAVEDFEDALGDWLPKANRLSEYLEQHREFWIPELEVLSAADWIDLTKVMTLDRESDLRKGLKQLRREAKKRIGSKMAVALLSYLRESDGVWPEALGELSAYSHGSLSSEILDRYWLPELGALSSILDEPYAIHGIDGSVRRTTHGSSLDEKKERVILEKRQVDPLWGGLAYVTQKGHVRYQVGKYDFEQTMVYAVVEAFELTHGRAPESIDELRPLIYRDIDEGVFGELFEVITCLDYESTVDDE